MRIFLVLSRHFKPKPEVKITAFNFIACLCLLRLATTVLNDLIWLLWYKQPLNLFGAATRNLHQVKR
jgi:hypothetical protein